MHWRLKLRADKNSRKTLNRKTGRDSCDRMPYTISFREVTCKLLPCLLSASQALEKKKKKTKDLPRLLCHHFPPLSSSFTQHQQLYNMVEKRKSFQTGQPVSTRRKAKKARVIAAQAERNAITPSKKAQRQAARPAKPVRKYTSDSDDEDQDGEQEQLSEDEDQEDEDEEEGVRTSSSSHTRGQQDSDDEDEEEDDSEDEVVGKGKKGFRKKVKKPSGKKGKVFADTVSSCCIWERSLLRWSAWINWVFDCPQDAVSCQRHAIDTLLSFSYWKNAMLSIIDQVAGKEEERAQKKNAQMVRLSFPFSFKNDGHAAWHSKIWYGN